MATLFLLGVYGVYFLIFRGGGEEGGIRVKNGGSVHIETISGKGFDFNSTALEFRSRGETRGCYDLVVVAGSTDCAGARLYQVSFAYFRSSDSPAGHHVGLSGRRLSIKRGRGWRPKGGGNTDLTFGDATVTLATLNAEGDDAPVNGNFRALACTFSGTERRFDLVAVDCR